MALKIITIIFTCIMVLMQPGCVWVEAYRNLQMKNDEQALSRLYTNCVIKYQNDPNRLRQCKLILRDVQDIAPSTDAATKKTADDSENQSTSETD